MKFWVFVHDDLSRKTTEMMRRTCKSQPVSIRRHCQRYNHGLVRDQISIPEPPLSIANAPIWQSSLFKLAPTPHLPASYIRLPSDVSRVDEMNVQRQNILICSSPSHEADGRKYNFRDTGSSQIRPYMAFTVWRHNTHTYKSQYSCPVISHYYPKRRIEISMYRHHHVLPYLSTAEVASLVGWKELHWYSPALVVSKQGPLIDGNLWILPAFGM